MGLPLAGARLSSARPARRGAAPGRPRGRILSASPRVRGSCRASAWRYREPSRTARSRQRRGPLPRGAGARRATRHAPARRPLPPRPRPALPAHGQATGGGGAPRHRDGDVPRDGHAVLAGGGGSRDTGIRVSRESGSCRLGFVRQFLNVAVRIGVRTGVAPQRFHLLTVRGRKSGRPRSTPIIVLRHGGKHWLVAPYGEREWVKNARAAGRVTLSRALHQETLTVEEVGPLDAAPVLKQYLGETPITRPFFKVSSDAPLAEFVREAPQHPVFRLGPRQ
ncbi:MAG: hypothetical protein DMD89_27170 [Candidatus Rokuibacteriota bacterium]|nr:MAG: hypothetical protein DMD89_27170 [Candidatus Rokubacteria bacterium]